jgi:dTDP-4-dehydrorhamnose reductase
MNGKILLIGRGYFGSAFARALTQLKLPFTQIWTGSDPDSYIRHTTPRLVINAAGYTGVRNVDDCALFRGATMERNVALPLQIRDACYRANVPWLHLSSGCIFNGRRHRPKNNDPGWTESDSPNFVHENGSFYTSSKFMAEQLIGTDSRCWICRVRMPFSAAANPKNYITKLLNYPILMEAENSLTHLEEAVETMLTLYLTHAPHGVYHIVNPGSLTTREAAALISKHCGQHVKTPRFSFATEEQLRKPILTEPRSSTLLSTHKLKSLGLALRPVVPAFIDCLKGYG